MQVDVNKELDRMVMQELLAHFQERPQIQNIDVMNVAGFCRNCLAKWRHKAARKLGVTGATYEDSLRYVYGMTYEEYKKQYQAKATPEQLEEFKRSEANHAKHEGLDLGPVPSIKSSVCCDDEANLDDACEVPVASGDVAVPLKTATLSKPVRVAILTISDRASRGAYEDKSGPAIKKAIENGARFDYEIGTTEIVPDELDLIQSKLRSLSEKHSLILTTGGTGLGHRDVTPEATLKVIEKRMDGIVELLRRESAVSEPMTWLSRAEAGSVGSCLIVNIPGHPTAATTWTTLLMPLIPRIVSLLES